MSLRPPTPLYVRCNRFPPRWERHCLSSDIARLRIGVYSASVCSSTRDRSNIIGPALLQSARLRSAPQSLPPRDVLWLSCGKLQDHPANSNRGPNLIWGREVHGEIRTLRALTVDGNTQGATERSFSKVTKLYRNRTNYRPNNASNHCGKVRRSCLWHLVCLCSETLQSSADCDLFSTKNEILTALA